MLNNMVKCSSCAKNNLERSFSVGSNRKDYCENCFKCQDCQKVFAMDATIYTSSSSSSKTRRDEGPALFCESCYVSRHAPRCHACKGVVAVGKSIQALGHTFHADCFACAACGSVLKSKFHALNDSPVCRACYLKATGPTCGECGKVGLEKWVLVSGGHMLCSRCHRKMRSCFSCASPLLKATTDGAAGFYEYSDGRSVCATCKLLQCPSPPSPYFSLYS